MYKHGLTGIHDISTALNHCSRLLIATDFDGTLCRLAAAPSQVYLESTLLDTLRRVAASSRITLAVISGRSLADLTSRVPLEIVLSGNHGMEIQGPGIRYEHAGAAALRPQIQAACEDLEPLFREFPGAWVEDKGLTATLHYRKTDPRVRPALRRRARHILGPRLHCLSLRSGILALEIRPKVTWDKGDALSLIARQLGPFDTVICLGDDDAPLFRANPLGINIQVGCARPPNVNYYLDDARESGVLLSLIADLIGHEQSLCGASCQAC